MALWDALCPPYSTAVIDPPWNYPGGWPGASTSPKSAMNRAVIPEEAKRRRPLGYQSLALDEIAALPVVDLLDENAHVYLWTTNRYLPDAFAVLDAWGLEYSTTLVWAKPPMGIGPGGAYSISTEFVLYARRGSLAPLSRVNTTWWEWSRGGHSVKPPAFMDVVEQVSPGPYVELFARTPRLGWDSWGDGYELGRAV